MKRFLSWILCLTLLLALLPMQTVFAAAGIEINSTNFPDANFRSYVANDFDTDANGSLSESEINAVTAIYAAEMNISDLTGVEYFTKLEKLYCWSNQLTTLDLSKNTALRYLSCHSNQLTSLNVTKNTALEYLDCNGNQLPGLNLTKNTALTELDCGGNPLTSLDVTKNTALVYLSCYMNRLTSLDLSKNTALTILQGFSNQLTSLDLSKNTALEGLYCYNNLLTDLDLSKNTALRTLYCNENQLTSLDLSMNTLLEDTNCSYNQLTSLNVTKNTALIDLDCSYNQLTSLKMPKNTALVDLDCNVNQLTSLDVSMNTSLENLWCKDNQLTSLDVSKNTELEHLRCSSNQLTDLNLPMSSRLVSLECENNKLTSLDLSWNMGLRFLKCHNNQLTSLDLSCNQELIEWSCHDNVRSIPLDQDSKFDLSTLPGFDVSKASDWVGGTVKGDILTATDNTITYTYDMGNGYTETFTLKADAELAIQTQPKNTYTQAGKTVKVTMKAQGEGLKYQWYIKNAGQKKYSKSSVTSATYSCKMNEKSKDRLVYCIVTDENGESVRSKTVILREAASITKQPKDSIVQAGETAKASGDGLKYQWYIKNAGKDKFSKSSVTKSFYSTKMTDKSAGRQVYCVVTDAYGKKVQSKTVTLGMTVSITKQPQSVAVEEGKTAKVTVKAIGDGLTYTWYFSDVDDATFKKTSTFKGNTYSVKMSEARDGRLVYCVITDAYGNKVATDVVSLKMK